MTEHADSGTHNDRTSKGYDEGYAKDKELGLRNADKGKSEQNLYIIVAK